MPQEAVEQLGPSLIKDCRKRPVEGLGKCSLMKSRSSSPSFHWSKSDVALRSFNVMKSCAPVTSMYPVLIGYPSTEAGLQCRAMRKAGLHAKPGVYVHTTYARGGWQRDGTAEEQAGKAGGPAEHPATPNGDWPAGQASRANGDRSVSQAAGEPDKHPVDAGQVQRPDAGPALTAPRKWRKVPRRQKSKVLHIRIATIKHRGTCICPTTSR